MSQISSDKVVLFHYTLTDTDNNTIETSRDGEPMAYLHGVITSYSIHYTKLYDELEMCPGGSENTGSSGT